MASAREKLEALGERRRRHDTEEEQLAEEIREALAQAERENVSKSEAARLLGVHRTTLYRVYT